MSALEETPKEDPSSTTKQLTPLQQLQVQSELDALKSGADQFVRKNERLVKKHQESHGEPGRGLLNRSVVQLAPAIHKFLIETDRRGWSPIVRAILRGLDEDVSVAATNAAVVISTEVINHISSKVKVRSLCLKIASAVMDERKAIKVRAAAPDRTARSKKAFKKLSTTDISNMHKSHRGTNRDVSVDEFDLQKDRLPLGLKCLNLFIEATGMIRRKRMKTKRVSKDVNMVRSETFVVATQKTLQELEGLSEQLMYRDPIFLPSWEKPKPWTSVRDGAFGFDLEGHMCLVKPSHSGKRQRSSQQQQLNDSNQMSTVYTAINALQDTAWQINRRVYEVVCQLDDMNDGRGGPHEDLLKIPRRAIIYDNNL